VRFEALTLPGCFRVAWEPQSDARGSFARTFCADEFAAHGLDPVIAQCNVSFNPQRGTLRGMHYQLAPAAEAKLIRCTRGALFDVLVDLRRDSSTFCAWVGIDLSCDDQFAIYAPEGVAHGFLTLEPATEVTYQMSHEYVPSLAAAVRYDDAAFGIEWPESPTLISDRDRDLPDFER
jgi:dTDP-4-dehydrorhamnose 3,5-epimerase